MISEPVISVTRKQSKNAERNRSAFFHPLTRSVLIVVFTSILTPGKSTQGQDQKVGGATKIKEWIRQLEDPSFLVRDQAKTRLKEAGAMAFGQLYRARDSADLEAQLTIKEIISEIKIQWIGLGDSQRVIDLMLDFQTRRPQDRLAIVDRLSWYPQIESWQPLYRIAIYDKSREVSCYAAARLLQTCFLRDEHPADDVQRSYQRLSAQRYFSVDSLLESDAAWGEKMIAICFALGKRQLSVVNNDKLFLPAAEIQNKTAKEWIGAKQLSPPLRESLVLANGILYQLATGLTDKTRTQNVQQGLDQVMLELVDEQLEPDDVVYVLDCLLRHSRFDAAKTVAKRLDVSSHRWHGFWMPEILRRQGKTDEAIQAARPVLEKLPRGNRELTDGIERLTEWNLSFWSTYLLRQKEDSVSIKLKLKLAELEFDAGNLAEAAQRANEVFDQSESVVDRIQSAQLMAEIENRNDRPLDQLKWLNRMIKLDPLSATALVKLSRLPKQQVEIDTKELRQKLDRAKGAFRDQYRLGSQMAQSSTPAESNLGRVKMAAAANSLAWLLFNLNEETEEATNMAETAVQLEPRNPDYLDTLALGQYLYGSKNRAVSLQKRAVFLVPGNKNFRMRLQKYKGRN